MKFGRRGFSLILFLAGLASSCASGPTPSQPASTAALPQAPVTSPVAPAKSFGTSGEYVTEAASLSDAGKYPEALGYLAEAIKLDPASQPAHALCGEAWAKLGKGTNARREFETTIEINGDTSTAAKAKEWLDRFKNPLPIAIAPLNLKSDLKVNVNWERGSGSSKKTRAQTLQKEYGEFAQKQYYNKLTQVLSECGFYSTAKLDKSELQSACRESAQKGAKIAIVTKSAEIRFREDTNRFVSFVHGSPVGLIQIVPGVSSLFESGLSFKIDIDIDIDVVQSNKCNIIKRVNETMNNEGVLGARMDSTLAQMFDILFQRVALDIHDALL